MVAHTCNPSSWKAKPGRSPLSLRPPWAAVQGQPELSESMPQNKKITEVKLNFGFYCITVASNVAYIY